MDALSKDIARDEIYQPRTELISWNSVGIRTIRFDDTLTISKIQQSLYGHIIHSKFLSWHSRKHKINQKLTRDEVHWKVFKLTRKESRLSMNIFMSKWFSEDNTTGNGMVQKNNVSILAIQDVFTLKKIQHMYSYTKVKALLNINKTH